MGREVFIYVVGNIVKIAVIVVFALVGALIPRWIGMSSNNWLIALGAGLGVLIGILLGLRLLAFLRQATSLWFNNVTAVGVLCGGAGLLFGLAVSALGLLLARQIGSRPYPAWEMLGMILATAGSVHLSVSKREDFARVFRPNGVIPDKTPARSSARIACKVLDTSAIIDGRIADICKTGFLEGTLLLPGFVLAELQRIADSSDTLKRNRGRRGLDILNRMQKDPSVTVKIYDRDFDDLTEVDTKIVRLARILDAKVVTNDFNLNKVAELYGVPVLNINELSNAIKPIVLPGEEMFVHILKDGKEFGQGIGYLEDGTMVVVDGGRQHIGEDLDVLVTSVLQTAAGRMIFGKPKELSKTAMAFNQ